jgi:hypothetical protein
MMNQMLAEGAKLDKIDQDARFLTKSSANQQGQSWNGKEN